MKYPSKHFANMGSWLQDMTDDDSAGKEQVARWALCCSRNGELKKLCDDYHALADGAGSMSDEVAPSAMKPYFDILDGRRGITANLPDTCHWHGTSEQHLVDA